MMNTSQLFVEQLLTGILSFLAICLLAIGVIDFDPLLVKTLFQYEGILLIVILAFSYPLGIFTDNIADGLLRRWDKRIKSKIHGTSNPKKEAGLGPDDEISVGNLLTKSKMDWLTLYFTYSRKRIRISRSSFLVMLGLIPGAVMVILKYAESLGVGAPVSMACWVSGLFFIGALISVWNWYDLTKDFHRKAIKTWLFLKDGD